MTTGRINQVTRLTSAGTRPDRQSHPRGRPDGLDQRGNEPSDRNVSARESSHETPFENEGHEGPQPTNKFLNRPFSSDCPIKRKSSAPGDRRPQRLNNQRVGASDPVFASFQARPAPALSSPSRNPTKHLNRFSPSVGPSSRTPSVRFSRTVHTARRKAKGPLKLNLADP